MKISLWFHIEWRPMFTRRTVFDSCQYALKATPLVLSNISLSPLSFFSPPVYIILGSSFEKSVFFIFCFPYFQWGTIEIFYFLFLSITTVSYYSVSLLWSCLCCSHWMTASWHLLCVFAYSGKGINSKGADLIQVVIK